MRLLIITQKVDRTDPILGFFHGWIEAFAARCDSVTVIGQVVGTYALPGNVAVLGMGKEKRTTRVGQILRFYRHAWRTRRDYDVVFVHMTPIWVLLGWPMWAVLGKPVSLWYEIKRGSWKLTVALWLVHAVFCATRKGIPHPHRKQRVIGHGIDTERFTPPAGPREPGLVVAVGRITRSKHFDAVLRAFAALPPSCRLVIAGGTVTDGDRMEQERLRDLMHRLAVADRVTIGWVAPQQIPALLGRAELMLHACVGGLDKAVLEAMSCGCPVVSSSEAAQEVLPDFCTAAEEELGDRARKVFAFSAEERQRLGHDLRAIVVRDHSLSRCIERLVAELQ